MDYDRKRPRLSFTTVFKPAQVRQINRPDSEHTFIQVLNKSESVTQLCQRGWASVWDQWPCDSRLDLIS